MPFESQTFSNPKREQKKKQPASSRLDSQEIPAPDKQHEPYSLPRKASFIDAEAYKLVSGLITIPALMAKYGPADFDAIMLASADFQKTKSPAPIPELSQSKRFEGRMRMVPEVLSAYCRQNPKESDEDAFIKLRDELLEDPRFETILKQYGPLIQNDSGHTDNYEIKAMRDYYELYHKKVAPY